MANFFTFYFMETAIVLELKYPPKIPKTDIKILKYPITVQLPDVSTSQPKRNEPAKIPIACI